MVIPSEIEHETSDKQSYQSAVTKTKIGVRYKHAEVTSHNSKSGSESRTTTAKSEAEEER